MVDIDNTAGTIETDLSGDDIDALFSDTGSDELGTSGSAPAEAASSPAAQAPQGGQEAPPAQDQVSAPSLPQGQQPPASQPTQPQAPVQPQQPGPQAAASQPPSFEEYVTQNYDALVKQFAEGPFRLSDTEKTAMGDAGPVVASYMARAQLHSMVMMQKAIQAALPDTVANLVAISRRSMDAENGFFEQYPELKAVNRQQMAGIAFAVRQANPQLPAEQLLPIVARTVAAAAGVQLKPQRGQPQPYVPAAQGQRGGVNPHPTPRTRVQPNGQMDGADQLAALNQLLMFS